MARSNLGVSASERFWCHEYFGCFQVEWVRASIIILYYYDISLKQFILKLLAVDIYKESLKAVSLII